MAADFNEDRWEPLPDALFDDDLLGNHADVGRHMKRRKGQRNAKAKAAAGAKGTNATQKDEHETFNINVDGGESDEEPGTDLPHQVRHFKGKQREVIDRARSNFHLYVLTKNAFPAVEELATWTELAYKHAGIYFYGAKYERKRGTVRHFDAN